MKTSSPALLWQVERRSPDDKRWIPEPASSPYFKEPNVYAVMADHISWILEMQPQLRSRMRIGSVED